MSNSLQPHGQYSPWNSPGQNTGVGSLSLLQGIFLTQELNQGLLHCRWILYQLSYHIWSINNIELLVFCLLPPSYSSRKSVEYTVGNQQTLLHGMFLLAPGYLLLVLSSWKVYHKAQSKGNEDENDLRALSILYRMIQKAEFQSSLTIFWKVGLRVLLQRIIWSGKMLAKAWKFSTNHEMTYFFLSGTE